MIKYLILDVDGTLTDGGVYYDSEGHELKKFCIKDGPGIIAARTAGIELVVLTGRECTATTRRLTELGVDHILQNISDKAGWMRQWMAENDVSRDSIAYIGDDINDLASMKLCGYVACPADAAAEVKEIADYISPLLGGRGAVRDVIEHYLCGFGVWDEAVNKSYGAGV